MNEFISTKFFRTLQKTSQTGIDANAKTLQKQYDDFAKFVFSVGNSLTNKTAYLNTLIYTHSEILGINGVTKKKRNSFSRKSR